MYSKEMHRKLAINVALNLMWLETTDSDFQGLMCFPCQHGADIG